MLDIAERQASVADLLVVFMALAGHQYAVSGLGRAHREIDGRPAVGLDIDGADLEEILSVDTEGWRAAIPQIRVHFAQFGDKLPGELLTAVDELESSLG